jgi:hypothetical protein
MATTKDFSRLGDIEGVAHYILVRNDGYVVSENYDEAVALSSSIVTTGKYCDSLADDLSGRQYIYCCIERKSGDNILVFSLGRYYLGIIKYPVTDPQMLADSIISFLRTLS